jgi:signal transduction histidine kinase
MTNFPAFVTLLLLSTAVSGVLVFELAPRRGAPGASALLLTIFADALWAAGYALEIAAGTLVAKLFWSQVQFIGIAILPVGIIIFALNYSGNQHLLSPMRILGLFAPAVLTIIVAFSNPMHLLLWEQIIMPSGDGIGPLLLMHGPWFYVIVIPYSYILLLASTVLILNMARRARGVYRSQAIIMLVGMMFPWLGNVLYITNLVPGIDLTPLTFMLTNIALAVGFLRFGLLEILPVAHKQVFEAMKDGVIIIDDKNRVLDLNPSAVGIFARSDPAALLGEHIRKILPVWESWQPLADANGEFMTEYEIGAGDDKLTYTVEATALPKNRNRQPGRILLLHNITALRRANEDIAIANRLKSQLLANFSHDLRSPLGAIIGYADMLTEELFGPINDEQRNASQEIQDSANAVLAFVNNIIGQAQLESGKMVVRDGVFPVVDIINPLLSTLRFHAAKKGLEFTCEIDPAMPAEIRGDSFWLRQMLLNLVSNAQKFTDHGSVRVKIGRAGDAHWYIKVIDTGIGIPREDQEKIFQVFEQSRNMIGRRQTGFGLGLAIVSELASLMEGAIQLDSEPGQGSTFTIFLPLKLE